MNASSATNSRLTIFCGKGGVGKTSLSLAFALRHADQGEPVLLVTSHPLRELAVSVSLAGLKEQRPLAAANLFIVHIDPLDILANKVRQVVPELLANRVLASPIYGSLITIAPGIKEIAFLGRLHELAEKHSDDTNSREYKLIVWDAPATGHFLQTLKVSQNFEAYLSGPFALLGREVAEFFTEVSNLNLIPVTALEEMAVDETIELCEQLSRELQIIPSALICNLASPLLASSDAEFAKLREEVARAAADSPELKFILNHHAIERALLDKLRTSIGAQVQIVRRKASWNSDVELLTDIAGQLGGIAYT